MKKHSRTVFAFIHLLAAFFFLLPTAVLYAADAPTGLMTDLLERTDTVWLDGFPSNLQLSELTSVTERFQTAEIQSRRPTFTRVVNDTKKSVLQTAWEIQVASKPSLLMKERGRNYNHLRNRKIVGIRERSLLKFLEEKENPL